MRKLLGLGACLLLGACQSLAANPEFSSLTTIPEQPSGATSTRIQSELARVRETGNAYLATGASFGEEDRASGGLTLFSSLYGAATSAFRPVVDNLQAAVLAQGAAAAWRSSLKPGERAKIYIHGYRAMDCVHAAGGALLQDAAGSLAPLRAELDALRSGALLQAAAEERKPAPDRAQLALLQAQIAKLDAIDATLRVEEGAVADAPYRIARVRREIEDAVEKRLAAVAPDYAAALSLIGETAKPATPKPAGDGQGPEVVGASGATLREYVADLTARVAVLERSVPRRAADAYERMGECIKAVG